MILGAINPSAGGGQSPPVTSEEEWKKTEKDEEEEEVCTDPNQPQLSIDTGAIHSHDTKKAAATCYPLSSLWSGPRPKTFMWEMEGFSLLLHPKEENDDSSRSFNNFFSGAFHAHGFAWRLELRLETLCDGKVYISFFLSLVSPHDGLIVTPKYKLIIYNSLNPNQSIVLKGDDKAPFCKATKSWGFKKIVAVETFKSPEGGFVVNDSCVFGAKISKIVSSTLQSREGLDQSLSLKRVDYSFSWEVDAKETINQISPTFRAGELNWRLKLYPKGNGSSRKNKYMSLYLFLDDTSNLLTSPVYVEFYLETEKDTNFSKLKVGRHHFTSEAYSWGWPNFLPLKNVAAADKKCIFQMKITKLGISKNLKTSGVNPENFSS